MTALEPDDPRRVGRYRVLSRLGEGGMGRVYLGASPAGRAVAVKVVRPELAGDPDFRARFRAEADAARRVSGAFTSPVLDADPDGPVPWLATAYVNGLNLKDAVNRHGPLPEPRLRTLGAGLGEALVAIHRAGLLHRDLKPANILLAKDGPKVIDFGISRAADGTRLTSEGQFVGTPGYMAPEQIRGGDMTAATDVFAFGAVLAFAATGRPPFGTGAVHTVLHRTLHEPPDLDGVPASLVAMVAACLSAGPGRRPPAPLLPQLLAAGPLESGWLPDTLDRELQERERTLVLDLRTVARSTTRRRLLLGAAAAGGLAAVGGGTAAALATSKDTPPPLPRFLWSATTPTGGDIAAPQVFARAVVVFGSFGPSAAFDAASGRLLWKDKIRSSAADENLFYARPAENAGYAALDPASRQQRWIVPLPAGYSIRSMAGPTGGLIALTDAKASIIGIDPRTGRRRWTHQGPADTELQGIQGGSLIALADRDAAASHYTTAYALDIATGAVRWSRPYIAPDLSLHGGDVAMAGRPGRGIEALSVTTGKMLWGSEVPDDYSTASPWVTVANGTVYLAGTRLDAWDAATGEHRWTYTPSASQNRDRTLIVDGRHAYTLDNRKLVALDARTGRRLWTADTPAADNAPLLALNGMVCTAVSGTTGPGLYCWDERTGKLLWSHPLASSSGDEQWILTNAGTLLVALAGPTLAAFHVPRR